MKKVIVYGTCCGNCNTTMDLFKAIAKEQNLEIDLIKESSPEAIMLAGIMTTPGVAIDGQVVHSGSVPDSGHVKKWLQD